MKRRKHKIRCFLGIHKFKYYKGEFICKYCQKSITTPQSVLAFIKQIERESDIYIKFCDIEADKDGFVKISYSGNQHQQPEQYTEALD